MIQQSHSRLLFIIALQGASSLITQLSHPIIPTTINVTDDRANL
jgi:hypothetical protein